MLAVWQNAPSLCTRASHTDQEFEGKSHTTAPWVRAEKITPTGYVTCTAEDCEICLDTLEKTPEVCRKFCQEFIDLLKSLN